MITDSNRGIAFMVFDGGYVSDVVLSNLTIDCRRHDWFWWGDGDPIHFNVKRRSEVDGVARAHEPPAGSIRNVLIRNVIAHGQGSSLIHGHPQSWLDGVSLENIKLFVANDQESPLQKTVNAMQVRWARHLKLKDVEVIWDKPSSDKWRSALRLEDAQDVELDGFRGRQASGRRGGSRIRQRGARHRAEFERQSRNGRVSRHRGREVQRHSPVWQRSRRGRSSLPRGSRREE